MSGTAAPTQVIKGRKESREEGLKTNTLAETFLSDRPMEQREMYYLFFSFCMGKLCLESSRKIFHHVEYYICLLDLL